MLTRRPHTAVISWQAEGTQSATGVYTPGATQTVTIACDVQPNSGGRFIFNMVGDIVQYSWTVFCDVLSDAANIPNGAMIKFTNAGLPVAVRDKDFKILNVFPYQKHTEIFV